MTTAPIQSPVNLKPLNPYFKLIEKTIYRNGKYIDLVYGISNTGNHEGLDAYYRKTSNKAEHFYRSYRWLDYQIPIIFLEEYEHLKLLIKEVPNGHKLVI